MIWHDGEVIPGGALRVGIDDRVFEHGLGLFETFRSWDGRAPLLGRHIGRLRDSAKALGIPLERVWLPDGEAVAALLDGSKLGADAQLRLTITAGSATEKPVAWMTARPLPARESLPLSVETATGYGEWFVYRHKMLNYWGRRIPFESAGAHGFDEVLLSCPEGHLWEGSRNNVLVLTSDKSRVIATPALHGPVLPGIMRRVALEFAASRGYAIDERIMNRSELFDAQAAFLTNSVRGARPVGRIDGRSIRRDDALSRLLVEELPTYIQSLDEPVP